MTPDLGGSPTLAQVEINGVVFIYMPAQRATVGAPGEELAVTRTPSV